MHIQLIDENDTCRWNLHQNGLFSAHSMYLALINNGHIERNKYLWSLKMPLKIKIFMWYMSRGIVLTKDNLAKRNWNGSKFCCFCMKNETIQHLFFDCHFAKFVWRALQYSFGFLPPSSVSHLYGNWLGGLHSKLKRIVFVGASAVCWAIWLSRNDMVFDKTPSKSYMQVLFRATHWFRFWAKLQKCEEDEELIVKACCTLKTTVM